MAALPLKISVRSIDILCKRFLGALLWLCDLGLCICEQEVSGSVLMGLRVIILLGPQPQRLADIVL